MSFTFDPYTIRLDERAVPVIVCRYNPEGSVSQRYMILPNVQCHSIQYREGAEPPAAQFGYVFDDSNPASPFPQQFHQVWPLTSSGPYVVQNDDRLVVLGFTSNGTRRVMFHGFANIPQVDLTGESQVVTFVAVGVAARCFDTPIRRAIYCDADDPELGAVLDVDLPVRFNPDGMPNCTPDGFDLDQNGDRPRPIFLDAGVKREPDPHTYWTLGKFVRYILATYNDEKFVESPDFSVLDDLLNVIEPVNGQFYNPDDESTYTAHPLVIRDYDATRKAWPDALAEQLAYHGFAMRFATEEDAAGEPWDYLEIYRKDSGSGLEPLPLYLQPTRSILDPGRTNVGALHLARDHQSMANRFVIETEPVRYEVSIVLAPGFRPAASDEVKPFIDNFLRANLDKADSDIRKKYRLYVADEAGDGHWSYDENEIVFDPIDLNAVFGLLEDDPDDTLRQYVRRLRPPERTLLTKDSTGKPLQAQLALSRDYTGPVPSVWDGTGHWQPISGGWELLKDRIGIYVNVENVEEWSIGEYKEFDAQNPGKTLRGITCQAKPIPGLGSGITDFVLGSKRFYLRLTCVIESDRGIPAWAGKRKASPSRFEITRVIDARDHFQQHVVTALSLHNEEEAELVVRDDGASAKAHALALRAANEFPPLAGSVLIPYLANGYRIGQQINVILGRGVSFRTNAGGEAGEAPVYPTVIGLTWDLTGEKQTTVLHLSDRRAEPGRV